MGEGYGPRPFVPPVVTRPAPPGSGRDAPTQPLPAARSQTAPGGGPGGTVQPTAAVTAPERRNRRGRAIFWLLVVVVIVAASASAAIVLAGREARRLRTPRITPEAALFQQLLTTSSSAQRLTATAVARSCRDAAPDAPSREALLGDLTRAVALRKSVLSALSADEGELLALPEGALLVTDLNTATVTGLGVEQEDQGWLQDLQATGCYSAPTNDIHYRAAALDAPAATGAAQRLARAWAEAGRTGS
jgi:hypothetical protein